MSEAANYYESQAGMGREFTTEVETSIERILMFPLAWGKISQELHHCHLQRFPYTLIYSIKGNEEVIIISLFHQRRKPLSWKENLD